MVIIDLLKEKDTGFIGAIGELAAWKYLWRHKKIYCLGFRGETRAFAGTWDESCRGLNKKQGDYLVSLLKGIDYSERAYDFIGPSFVDSTTDVTCFRYLVEVKTTRQGRLHGSRRTAGEIRKARSLGFIPLLVHVELLSNWKFKVTCKQLKA
jgi:hypothetical protein